MYSWISLQQCDGWLSGHCLGKKKNHVSVLFSPDNAHSASYHKHQSGPQLPSERGVALCCFQVGPPWRVIEIISNIRSSILPCWHLSVVTVIMIIVAPCTLHSLSFISTIAVVFFFMIQSTCCIDFVIAGVLRTSYKSANISSICTNLRTLACVNVDAINILIMFTCHFPFSLLVIHHFNEPITSDKNKILTSMNMSATYTSCNGNGYIFCNFFYGEHLFHDKLSC